MKQCLANVNVLFPLLVRHHAHHDRMSQWFDGLMAGEALLCRFVQLGMIRLLGNTTVMGKDALSASAAWQLIEKLMEDERMEFVAEPAGLDSAFPKLFKYPVPTNNLISDAYLAAFAICGQIRFATVDTGFQQFRGLDLELLTP